ncbi:MAG TPA: GNAT family N-acetyltransferase [Phycisphaerae bacterium]|jgi:L-amino acid N-acyltransferase YncA|nr:GNAT family N-acetyltransferase [Phycisphaerae bacterium]
MIRPATESDVPAILGLLRELAEYEKLSHACVATEELLRQHLFGPEKAAEVIVAELDAGTRQIVGYALFFKSFSTFLARPGLYLEDIYVQPQHRNQGIGKSMLRRLAQIAVERNYGRVEWCVLDWNAPSIAFYKSLGAFPMDEWTLYRLTGDALQQFASRT